MRDPKEPKAGGWVGCLSAGRPLGAAASSPWPPRLGTPRRGSPPAPGWGRGRQEDRGRMGTTVAPEMLATAEVAADAAGAVIRPLFRSPLLIEAKGDASPVTEADRGAERAMRAALSARFPDHGVWGEEYGADRPDAEWVWLLDPIDGTRAFVTGRPL